MKRKTTPQENKMDENYQRECGSLHRLVLRLFRRSINRVVKTVISRAYERGQIDSHTMHEMAGCCDRILWPERYERKRGTVVQTGNIVGGDMVGGDLYK